MKKISYCKIVDFLFSMLYNLRIMKSAIRQPKQERSIEKKNKIIEAGYQLFSEVGYYGTNTAEIAKRAGVSTGIVYGYFKDKRDILISVLSVYIEEVFHPFLKYFESLSAPIGFEKVIPEVLDRAIKTHNKNTKIHEALHSLASSDEAVGAEFIALEDAITKDIANIFQKLDVKIENPLEKIHFAMDIVQSFSHEYVFDKHDYIDYNALRELVSSTLISLFKY